MPGLGMGEAAASAELLPGLFRLFGERLRPDQYQ
jgi:hypothetical protein